MFIPSCTERDKLRLLLQYSRKLSVFQKRATLVQECLEEVLENGEWRSMSSMCVG